MGVILGVLVGLRVSQRWQYAWRRMHDIDRLLEQCQEVFRQRA